MIFRIIKKFDSLNNIYYLKRIKLYAKKNNLLKIVQKTSLRMKIHRNIIRK